MSMLVYRDRDGVRDLLGRLEHNPGNANATFTYDPAYLASARSHGEFGISERLPLDEAPFEAAEFGPYFQGLLPEGEVYGNLALIYQVPRSDYLSVLENLGCESIGALTFVRDGVDPNDYAPRYDPLTDEFVNILSQTPVRAATRTASSTRLSLSGAQSKVAWFLPEGADARKATVADWRIPQGTAPSSHIVKVSARGEEDIALNELACARIARACGIEVASVTLIPDIPGAIAVERYDRTWISTERGRSLLRLHQEDFCQALGLPTHLKYQIEGTDYSYLSFCADLIDATSSNAIADRLEFANRTVFNYVVGNTDAHLKNSSLLYNRTWTGRQLAPLYDVTCIPLTGYSTKMAFDIGAHRQLDEVDEKDLLAIALDLDVGLDSFDRVFREILEGFTSVPILQDSPAVSGMLDRILEDAAPRLEALRRFLG